MIFFNRKLLIPMLFLAFLPIACGGGSAPYDAFKAKLESENVDPSHYVVNVGLRAQCEAHAETGFMENYDDERRFTLASNNRTEHLYLQYDDADEKVLVATILAMRETVDGGTDMKVFCESLGFGL